MTQYGTWVSYGGAARVGLALVLLAAAGGLAYAGTRLPLPALYRAFFFLALPRRGHHAVAPHTVPDGEAVQGHLLFLRADADRVRCLGPVRIRLPVRPGPHRAECAVEAPCLRRNPQPVHAPASRSRRARLQDQRKHRVRVSQSAAAIARTGSGPQRLHPGARSPGRCAARGEGLSLEIRLDQVVTLKYLRAYLTPKTPNT
jgi:hypothetical protein